MADAEQFTGETAFVTGAASGIGLAVARCLARNGAAVVLSDFDAARGNAATEALRRDGLRAAFIQADLSGQADYLGVAEAAAKPFGPVAMFVHSASPARRNDCTVGVVDEQEWDAMLSVNLRAGFFLARALGLAMSQRAIRGRMVFVTSLHSETPRNLPHYSAAKAGQVMAMKELARFFGPAGIRVNGVAPGAVPGGGFAGDFVALAQRIPLRRVGDPDEIARVVVALLSDQHMPYVTGAVIPADGGLALYNWIDAASVAAPE
jgi:3-oxoacyl-[acyl-carrier protein] reductase